MLIAQSGRDPQRLSGPRSAGSVIAVVSSLISTSITVPNPPPLPSLPQAPVGSWILTGCPVEDVHKDNATVPLLSHPHNLEIFFATCRGLP